MAEPIKLEIDLAPSAGLDLTEEWMAWLDEHDDIPSTIAGLDTSITYRDDAAGTAWA